MASQQAVGASTGKGGKGPAAFWRKAGLVHGATMTTDGVCSANDGPDSAMEVNFVGNYHKPGPASKVFHVLKPERNRQFGLQRYYARGNIMES